MSSHHRKAEKIWILSTINQRPTALVPSSVSKLLLQLHWPLDQILENNLWKLVLVYNLWTNYERTMINVFLTILLIWKLLSHLLVCFPQTVKNISSPYALQIFSSEFLSDPRVKKWNSAFHSSSFYWIIGSSSETLQFIFHFQHQQANKSQSKSTQEVCISY